MHVRGLAHYPVVSRGTREARMRKAVSIMVVAALVGIFLDALLGPDENNRSTGYDGRNRNAVFGVFTVHCRRI